MTTQAYSYERHWQGAAILVLLAAAVLLYVLYPGSKLYWPYMLSAYWLGVFAYIKNTGQLSPDKRPSLPRYLFPKEVWLHRSSINDCVIVIVNFAIFWSLFQYVSFTPDVFQHWARHVLGQLFPGHAPAAAPPWSITGFYIVAAMLTSELFFYVDHRLQHTVPILWEFHKVHHSAEVMTPLTVNRVHPFVYLLDTASRNFGAGIVLGVFLFFYPNIKTVDVIAMTLIGFNALNVIGGNLHHSHIWLRFPARIERIVTSPAIHQVHHSRRPEHRDKNYGTVITLWDWLFGSLYLPKDGEEIVFGVHDGEAYRTLWGLYVVPVQRAWARIVRPLTIR